MPVRPLIACLGLLAFTVSCSRDPNVVKARYVQNGNKYFQKEKYKEASIMYRTALQKDAKYGEAYYRLGLTELKLHQPMAAINSFRRAVELLKPETPERTEARVQLADLYLNYLERSPKRDGEIVAETKRTAAELIKADPKSVDGHRLQGRMDIVLAQEAASRRDQDASKEAVANAIKEFNIAYSLKPDDTDVVTHLARALTANAQFPEAEKLYLSVVNRDKTQVQSYMELYRLYMFQNKPDQAEAILKKVIEDNPKRYELLINLAQHYYGHKRRDEVVKVLETLKSHAKDYPEAFEQAGAFYFRLGDGAEAMRQYEEGIKANPDKKDLYQKLIIEVLMAQGKKEDAKKVNDSILAANPKDTDALGLQGALLLDRGDLQNAASQLQTVVSRAPSNFVAHYNYGRALAAKGDMEPARSQFSEAIRLRPDYTAARLALTQVDLNKREFEPAIKAADDILAYDKNNMQAHLVRSAAYLGLNDVDKAEAELRRILQANPNSQDAMIQMGAVYVRQKKFKEAEEIFRKCYEMNPANSRGLMGQVDTMMLQNEPDKATTTLRAEIQKYPTRLELRLALANLEVRSKKFDLAIADYKSLLDKVDRKSASAADLYVRLGDTESMAGNLPAAIDALQKARDILPNNANVLNSLALMLDTAGQKKEAKVAYESALRIESENPVALNNLAYIIAESPGGDLDQALTFAQRANQKLPQAVEIADTLGWIYLKKNLPDNALEIFRNNVSKSPNNSTYRYHLGMALFQKGDKAHAKQELQNALTHNPSKEEESNIKDLLQKT